MKSDAARYPVNNYMAPRLNTTLWKVHDKRKVSNKQLFILVGAVYVFSISIKERFNHSSNARD